MEKIKEIWIDLQEYLNIPVFDLGETSITVWKILYFTVLLVILIYLSGKLKKWLIFGLLSRSHLDIGVRTAVGTITRYLVITFGFVILMQTAGIDLSALTILAGALGVGIGFGLQNITNNFVSGIIILFERPIKVGDRIEVGNVSGDVVKISMRATTVVTNDNISIIVPNSEFISSQVINWSHTDRRVRFNYPIGVAYKEDPEKIKKILLKVADDNEDVLKNPPPDVLFDGFGDSSINFILRVWTSVYINRPGVLKSKLYYEIFRRFREEGVEIPFPQRDLHVKNESINISESK